MDAQSAGKHVAERLARDWPVTWVWLARSVGEEPGLNLFPEVDSEVPSASAKHRGLWVRKMEREHWEGLSVGRRLGFCMRKDVGAQSQRWQDERSWVRHERDSRPGPGCGEDRRNRGHSSALCCLSRENRRGADLLDAREQVQGGQTTCARVRGGRPDPS